MKTEMPKAGAIREAAFRWLSQREYGEKELFRKLSHRGFEKQAIEAVLSELKTQGLLNEARFIEAYAHGRMRRGFGPLRIRAELMERGVAEEDYEPVLSSLIPSEEWVLLAGNVLSKKFNAKSLKVMESDDNSITRKKQFLFYRGFDQETIQRVFSDKE